MSSGLHGVKFELHFDAELEFFEAFFGRVAENPIAVYDGKGAYRTKSALGEAFVCDDIHFGVLVF